VEWLAPTPNPSPAQRTRRPSRGWSEWSLVSAVCGRTSKKGRVSFGLKVGSESIEPSPCATSGFDGPLLRIRGMQQPQKRNGVDSLICLSPGIFGRSATGGSSNERNRRWRRPGSALSKRVEKNKLIILKTETDLD
jgi:hypothetical protein